MGRVATYVAYVKDSYYVSILVQKVFHLKHV